MSLVSGKPSVAKAAEFAVGYSPAEPFLIGPGQWHEVISPRYKEFLDRMTEVMEQCAIAWDARRRAEERLEPDSGVLTRMSAGTVTAFLSDMDTRLGPVDFLYLDEP